MTETEYAIETDELTRRFGDVVAVDDVSLTVERGEVFGFLGPNGAGKSTTINTLLGFIDPTEGHAEVLGHDVTEEPTAIRARIGLLPEGFEPYRNLSGREHIVSAIETKDADDDPDDLIERVGLDPEDARRPASDYSTGMHQRLALAIALVGNPDLLILDEPSSGLDPNGVSRLRRIVREEVDRGATVFFSSHILDEVEKVSDRVGVMQDGELVAVDTIQQLRSRYELGTVVEVTVTQQPDPTEIAAINGVTDVDIDGDTVRATCADTDGKMAVISTLEDSGGVKNIDISETSLETLFEEITATDSSTHEAAPGSDGRAVAATGGERR
jgi:ABC-2 type transport system ATP-binding protein